MVKGGTSRNKLGAVGSGFDVALQLGEPVDGRAIKEVEDAGDRTAVDQVMHEVGILGGGSDDGLTEGCGHVAGQDFLDIAIDGAGPSSVRFRQVGVVREVGDHADAGIAELMTRALR